MKMQEIQALVANAVGDVDLHPAEIPAIDLYLDQITSLVADKRQEGSPLFQNRVLTKTMVNNYSKDGLIFPVKGKKYSKEHIIQMLMVYELKNTLSIGEIKRILQNVYALPDVDERFLEEVYFRFLEIKEYERQEAFNLLQLFLSGCALNPEDDADFFTMILGLASMSSYLKNIVQSLLEAHYPDMDAERLREELEQREELKRRRAKRKSAKREEAVSEREELKRRKNARKQPPAPDAKAVDEGVQAQGEQPK